MLMRLPTIWKPRRSIVKKKLLPRNHPHSPRCVEAIEKSVGLILDTSVLIKDEHEEFKLAEWLRKRSPEPIGISAITYSELRVGIEAEKIRFEPERGGVGSPRRFDEWKS